MRKLIMQAVCDENHLDAVNEALSVPNPNLVILSTAFLNAGGMALLEPALGHVAEFTTIFAGIRNGITSAQGLQKAIELGCRTFVVDTGSRLRIFHPKIYLMKGAELGHLIIGSANVTHGGLNWNVEASVWLQLRMDDPEDETLIDEASTRVRTH